MSYEQVLYHYYEVIIEKVSNQSVFPLKNHIRILGRNSSLNIIVFCFQYLFLNFSIFFWVDSLSRENLLSLDIPNKLKSQRIPFTPIAVEKHLLLKKHRYQELLHFARDENQTHHHRMEG